MNKHVACNRVLTGYFLPMPQWAGKSSPSYEWSTVIATKQFERVAIRYDMLLANFMAFVKLAAIAIWLR